MSKLMAILILLLSLTISADSAIKFPSIVSKKMLISDGKIAKLSCSVDSDCYELGDTVNIKIVLVNISDTSLMATDPSINPCKYSINHSKRKMSVDIGNYDYGDMELTPRKIRVGPGDSLTYKLKIPIDAAFEVDTLMTYSITFFVNCWLYTDQLGYLTETEDNIAYFKEDSHIVQFLDNSFGFYPGSIDVLIIHDPDIVHFYNWQKSE